MLLILSIYCSLPSSNARRHWFEYSELLWLPTLYPQLNLLKLWINLQQLALYTYIPSLHVVGTIARFTCKHDWLALYPKAEAAAVYKTNYRCLRLFSLWLDAPICWLEILNYKCSFYIGRYPKTRLPLPLRLPETNVLASIYQESLFSYARFRHAEWRVNEAKFPY